jgi:hypothetical protein
MILRAKDIQKVSQLGNVETHENICADHDYESMFSTSTLVLIMLHSFRPDASYLSSY